MELFIELHDHADVIHNQFSYKFDSQSTLEQLKKKIYSVWKIDNEHLNLFYDSGQILVGLSENSLHSFGFKNGSRVITKHALLSNWFALLEFETAFQQTNEAELKKSIYTRSKDIVKVLIDSLFFIAYPSFNSRCTNIEKKFLTYFDRKLEAIQNSCQSYFTNIYGKNVKITFNSREDGSRSGCICIIENQTVISKFFVKTHHGAGSQSSNTRYDVDLKELFVYKFLEDLKMGAEVHFIDNDSFSKWMIYIGSQEIPGFKTLEFLELTEPQNIHEYSKFVVQMLFVYSVLMLGDHHTANMGVSSAGKPFIVDFFIIGKPLASVKDLYECVRMAKKFNENLGTFNERLKISLDYLKQSNFLNILESSVESFLQHQKPMFDKSLLVFDKPQKTDDLIEYLKNVKKNVQLFNEYSLI